jgi:MFS family permease
MVVGRALQGLSGGVIPLGIGIMRDELPRERLGAATATMSSSLGVGAALGLPAAALIADNLSWHMLFWTSAAAGGIAVVLVHVFVPESPIRTGGRFDLTGAAGLSVALVCLLLAISKGADWDSRVVIGLFITAAVVLLAWGWWELRSARQPLVNLRTAARPQVLLTNLSAGTLGFATFALSLVLPQLLQLPVATGYGLGESMLVVGLVMAPQGLVMMSVSPLSARISLRWGPKATLMLGTAVVAAGYALGILLMSEIWQLVLVSCVIGAGVGFAYGALPTLIMSAVPVSETAAANSLNTLLRAIGSSVSSAVVGVVLAKMTTTFGVPSLAGLRTVLAIGAGAALAALIIASFLPRADHRATPSTTSEAGSPTDG